MCTVDLARGAFGAHLESYGKLHCWREYTWNNFLQVSETMNCKTNGLYSPKRCVFSREIQFQAFLSAEHRLTLQCGPP